MHIPVLLNEVIEGLSFRDGDVFVDCTFGLGGHSKKVCEQHRKVSIIGIDLNGDTLYETEKNLSSMGCDIKVALNNFRNLDQVLNGFNLESVDKYLFDLGWSSVEFEESGRGFSFMRDEPLIMTYSSDPRNSPFTAYDIVNEWQEESIEAIILGYGEERRAKKIAKAICRARERKDIKTTFELLEAIRPAFPNRSVGKTHFATKTFQALRIAVNDELESLRDGLKKAVERTNAGGRIAVITFHSLEDRIVKNFFKEVVTNGKGALINKKPLVPKREEVKMNPRSRSAKLRIIEINDKNRN